MFPAPTVELLVLSLNAIGSILVGFAAIRVHHRFLHEHKVDQKVFATMKAEQRLGVLGIVFIAIGYLIQVFI